VADELADSDTARGLRSARNISSRAATLFGSSPESVANDPTREPRGYKSWISEFEHFQLEPAKKLIEVAAQPHRDCASSRLSREQQPNTLCRILWGIRGPLDPSPQARLNVKAPAQPPIMGNASGNGRFVRTMKPRKHGAACPRQDSNLRPTA
jgi:hypothetical protein